MLLPSVFYGQIDSIAILAKAKINEVSENPVYSILLYIDKADKVIFNKGYGKLDKDSFFVSKNDKFRIASSTKLFVSTIILQLIEEGKILLNDEVFEYVKGLDYLDFENFQILNNKKYANEITIKQLLSHRSGLADIFSDKEETFFSMILKNPEKQYSVQSIAKLYYKYKLNLSPHFEPNKGWHYSDMNYFLLGLIIEKIDQTSLAESIRNRILNPLKMKDTYFEFYEKPTQKNNLLNQYVGSVNFSKINTSFDWSGGGLVSTNKDLALFIKSLFNLKLINRESLNKMIDVKYTKDHENRYGLGIYESHYNGHIYFGHYGFYGTYVGYCPENKTTISYSISQAIPDFNVYSFINKTLKLAE